MPATVVITVAGINFAITILAFYVSDFIPLQIPPHSVQLKIEVADLKELYNEESHTARELHGKRRHMARVVTWQESYMARDVTWQESYMAKDVTRQESYTARDATRQETSHGEETVTQ